VVTTRRQGKHREYVAHLLRRSYREGGTVKKETVANLSHLPEEVVELIRGALRGQRFVAAEEAFAVERSLPAGHVEAALLMASRLELARLLDRKPSRERALCLAMIEQRVLGPGSKLAMSRAFAQSTLAGELGAEDADEDELYRAMDWLLAGQGRIERALARRHLAEGTLVLYDVSASYFEGAHARRRSWATRVTGGAARCRSSTGCSARALAARSRSSSSRARSTTTRRCRRSSTSFVGASGLQR